MARATASVVGCAYGLLTDLFEKPAATMVYLSRNPYFGNTTTKRGILSFPRLIDFDVRKRPVEDFVVLNSNNLIWSVVVPRAFLKDVKYLSTGSNGE
jgi:hypothetical protein